MKRIISMVLSIAMLICVAGAFGVTAFAYNDTFELDYKVCGDYKYFLSETGTASIVEYTGSAKQLDIPSELDGYTVTEIVHQAFYHCNSLVSITIPDSVTLIHFGGIEYCENLTSVKVPGSVETIADYNFGGCDKLTDVELGNGITNLYTGVFHDCPSLKEITIPESVKIIGESSFSGCDNLSSITVLSKDCNMYSAIPHTTTIYGYKGSTAEEYAISENIKFVALDNSGEQGIISESTDDTYVIGSEKGASIHCGYPIDQFSGVMMDGVEVSSDNYTLTEGLTILTFKTAYLNSLKVGKHEVMLNFVSGSVKSILTIENKAPDTPADSEKPAETEKPTTTENAVPNKPAGTNNTSPNTGANTAAFGVFSATAVIWLALIALKKKR